MKYFAIALLCSLVYIPSYAQTNHPLFFVGMELRPPASLEGTTASLVWQNFKLINLEGLRLIEDDAELSRMVADGGLLLTGASVDIAALGVPKPLVQWLTARLLELERLGFLDATLEQKAQNVFHVTVFREYLER